MILFDVIVRQLAHSGSRLKKNEHFCKFYFRRMQPNFCSIESELLHFSASSFLHLNPDNDLHLFCKLSFWLCLGVENVSKIHQSIRAVPLTVMWQCFDTCNIQSFQNCKTDIFQMYEKIKTSAKSLFSFSTYLAWSPFRGHQYVKKHIITFESLNIE